MMSSKRKPGGRKLNYDVIIRLTAYLLYIRHPLRVPGVAIAKQSNEINMKNPRRGEREDSVQHQVIQLGVPLETDRGSVILKLGLCRLKGSAPKNISYCFILNFKLCHEIIITFVQ